MKNELFHPEVIITEDVPKMIRDIMNELDKNTDESQWFEYAMLCDQLYPALRSFFTEGGMSAKVYYKIGERYGMII